MVDHGAWFPLGGSPLLWDEWVGCMFVGLVVKYSKSKPPYSEE